MEMRSSHRTDRFRSASGLEVSGEGRPVRIRRSRCGWLGLVFLIASGEALAATAPAILPPEGGYFVKWYQSDGATPVSSWQIETRPLLGTGASSIVAAQVAAEPSCWSVAVPVGEAASVRIRSVAGTQVSGWTATASVPKPNGSYVVKWFQPDGVTDAASWDIEITPTSNPGGRYVVGALVRSEPICWALRVPITEPSTARIRPVSGTTVAPWSPYTVVPEPGFAASCGAGLAGLSALARRRRRRV